MTDLKKESVIDLIERYGFAMRDFGAETITKGFKKSQEALVSADRIMSELRRRLRHYPELLRRPK